MEVPVERPGSTEEVAAVVRQCAEAGTAIVPQGGNTGLVGGTAPRPGAVVLSLTRLDGIGPHDGALDQVTVGAGATLAALQAAVPDAGLDFGARDSATIGGIVACDAGGPRALRHGTARSRVLGVEAVLADGSVVSSVSELSKDNAGYDLSQLLVGSEGTLGVITQVRWATVPRLRHRVAALIPTTDAPGMLARLRSPHLEACDFWMRGCVPNLPAPMYLLAEFAADHDPTEEMAERLGGVDVSIADDTASRARLWALREGIPEHIRSLGEAVKLDVGVPLSRLGELLATLPEVCGDARPFLFGHLGDGNVHVNLVGEAPDADAVLQLVLDLGGTISAEHGIGTAKAAWLERAVGPGAYAAMRAVKRALDPQGILNPGVIFSDAGSGGPTSPWRRP